MGNAPPISRQQLRDLRQKYDKETPYGLKLDLRHACMLSKDM